MKDNYVNIILAIDGMCYFELSPSINLYYTKVGMDDYSAIYLYLAHHKVAIL